MKISTIIPVYNTSEYLKKCIDSIVNQTIGFANIELIIVNDGSKDDSENLIKQYQKKYRNIKYIYQKNSGQASARNNGLRHATGEFISFIDSDDWIEADMYKNMYDSSFDIISCDYSFINNNKKEYVSFRNCIDNQKNFIIMNTGPCNLLVKRDLLNKFNFNFPEGIIYEDLASIPLLGIYSSRIKYVEESFYNYFIRDNSTMQQKEYSVKLEDIFKSVDILHKEWIKIDNNKIFKEEIEYLFIRRLLMSASLRFIKFNDPNNCIEKISQLIKNKFPRWKDNLYYKKLPFSQKIVAILAYNKNVKALKLLYLLNNMKNRRK